MIKKCVGCGAILQDNNPLIEGYTTVLTNDLCKRCFRMKNYGEYEFVTKDNLEYVSLELLQEITNISFSSNLLFEGLEDVNLPYIKEYKSKIEEIFEIRFQYLKDYVKEKKIPYTLSV